MIILIITVVILFGLFTAWLILMILSKATIVEKISLSDKTLHDMARYSTSEGWEYDTRKNIATKVVYKHKISEDTKLIMLVLWLTAAFALSVLGTLSLVRNTFVETRQYENKLEREKIVVRLKYYDNYGTEIYKNETALQEYTITLEQVKDFNSKVYFANNYKDNIWIGAFIDKGYVGLEPIEYAKL